VAEGNGLLNRRRDKISTEGSNPSLSATIVTAEGSSEQPNLSWFLLSHSSGASLKPIPPP
jgi:hypothetical protein